MMWTAQLTCAGNCNAYWGGATAVRVLPIDPSIDRRVVEHGWVQPLQAWGLVQWHAAPASRGSMHLHAGGAVQQVSMAAQAAATGWQARRLAGGWDLGCCHLSADKEAGRRVDPGPPAPHHAGKSGACWRAAKTNAMTSQQDRGPPRSAPPPAASSDHIDSGGGGSGSSRGMISARNTSPEGGGTAEAPLASDA
jgi:hypothetical protein